MTNQPYTNYGTTGTTVNGFSTAHQTPMAATAPVTGTGVGATRVGIMQRVKNFFYKCMPFLQRKPVTGTVPPVAPAPPVTSTAPGAY